MWVQMGFRRFRPNETFFLAILLLWYSSCSKCLFVLARVLTLTLLLGGFRWNITCHGMAQTCWKIVWTTHSAMEDLWISYPYIYIIHIYIWLSIHICHPNSTRLSHTHAFQNPLHAVVTKMLRAAPEKSVRCRWWLLGGVWPKRLLLSRILLSAHWWRQSFMLGWGWDLYLLQMSLGLVMSLAIATLKKIEKHSCHYFSGKLHFYLFGVTIKSYF